MGAYKHVDENGNVTYTDQPSTASGSLQQLGPQGRVRSQSEEERERKEQELARKAIKEAKSRAPKIVQYLEYAEYLRTTNPWKLERVVNELKNNKDTVHVWVALQKYPQFRPLSKTALGIRAGEVHLGLVAEAASGGKAEKWMEHTLKEMMKRDRWPGYVDVLGAKATTLPEKKETFSLSRLGQYMKEEVPKLQKALKEAIKSREAAEAELRGARLKGPVRVGNLVVDHMIQQLDPQLAKERGDACIGSALNTAFKEGRLSPGQYETAHGYYAKGEYVEMRNYLAAQEFERAGNGCPAYFAK